MSAKVRSIGGAWWVVTHYNSKRTKRRIGTTKADQRKAQKIADEINARLAVGTFRPEPEPEDSDIPFHIYARGWYRSEVELPIRSGADNALSEATAELHERHVRRYLIPFFGSRGIQTIRVPEVKALYDHCLENHSPPSERSVEMVISTLRRILAYAEAREETGRNPVEVWKRSRGRRRRSARARLAA